MKLLCDSKWQQSQEIPQLEVNKALRSMKDVDKLEKLIMFHITKWSGAPQCQQYGFARIRDLGTEYCSTGAEMLSSIMRQFLPNTWAMTSGCVKNITFVENIHTHSWGQARLRTKDTPTSESNWDLLMKFQHSFSRRWTTPTYCTSHILYCYLK